MTVSIVLRPVAAALKKESKGTREKWWAERDSIRYLNTDGDLEGATLYVRDGQDGGRFSQSTSPKR
jgi:hypothetical protein